MRFASLKMTTINPMSNQITVIIRIADYIEVYWSSKNFISVALIEVISAVCSFTSILIVDENLYVLAGASILQTSE